MTAVDGIELSVPEIGAVTEAMAGAEILLTFVWDPAFATAGLRWVQSVSAGTEQFPLGDLRRAGIVLTSARGIHGPQVSEHAFALLLALTRGVGVAMRDAERRTWHPRMAEELTGRTVGVLGLGAVGEEIARKARAWGQEVIGTRRRVDGYRGAASRVFPPGETLEACRRAEIIFLSLPDLPETGGSSVPRRWRRWEPDGSSTSVVARPSTRRRWRRRSRPAC
jgi:phosphoglycerate dehydrogenase-like enzyme